MGLMGMVHRVMSHPDQGDAIKVFEYGLGTFLAVIAPLAVGMLVLGILVNIAQVGFVFSPKAAAPKWSKINPKNGLKRLFSIKGVWEGGKSFSKIFVVAIVCYFTMNSVIHTVIGARPVNLEPLLAFTGSKLVSMARSVALAGLVIAGADYIYQRHSINTSLKMTRQEAKDEARQSEGDPIIKGRIRREAYRLSRLRMLAAVAQADVVITNPTHVAVALKYEKDKFKAPVVVAKGADEVAMRIKEEAFLHGIAVIEDPPLARAVHAACELGDAIPKELYVAVARLLAFVYSLTSEAKGLGVAHRRAFSEMGL